MDRKLFPVNKILDWFCFGFFERFQLLAATATIPSNRFIVSVFFATITTNVHLIFLLIVIKD